MINDYTWDKNPDCKLLDLPAKGDIVLLKCTGESSYLVKVIVISTHSNIITGRVQSIFDWGTKGQIIGGAIMCLLEKELLFKKHLIKKVIKKKVGSSQERRVSP